MAIQPVDLQLAYLAAPASAAAANVVETGPAIAAQATQAAFAAQVEQRQETVAETTRAEGSKIHPDRNSGGNEGYAPRKRKRPVILSADAEQGEASRSKDGEAHFIDTTA